MKNMTMAAMFRACAVTILASVAAMAHGHEALTVTSDSQAILVTEGQPSPWLRAAVRQGHAGHVGEQGVTTYTYLHLLPPVNFAASSAKDHFSTNAYHVYDLSFSSNDGAIASKIESMVGGSVTVKGFITESPTGTSPVQLHMVVTDIEASP
jgi:hypothetical protein